MEEDLQKRRGRRKEENIIPNTIPEYDFFLIRDVKTNERVVPEGESEKSDSANKSLAFFLE
jgi:hypothetical protein